MLRLVPGDLLTSARVLDKAVSAVRRKGLGLCQGLWRDLLDHSGCYEIVY